MQIGQLFSEKLQNGTNRIYKVTKLDIIPFELNGTDNFKVEIALSEVGKTATRYFEYTCTETENIERELGFYNLQVLPMAKAATATPEFTGEQSEVPTKGFVHVTKSKVISAIERIANQEFSAQIRKTETGKYEVHSLVSGNHYHIELNRGVFGITGHCDCPDFAFSRLAKDEVCKHLAAVYQFERREVVVSFQAA